MLERLVKDAKSQNLPNQDIRLNSKTVVEKKEKGVKIGQRCGILLNGYTKRQKKTPKQNRT